MLMKMNSRMPKKTRFQLALHKKGFSRVGNPLITARQVSRKVPRTESYLGSPIDRKFRQVCALAKGCHDTVTPSRHAERVTGSRMSNLRSISKMMKKLMDLNNS
jgi:hypothetical protein